MMNITPLASGMAIALLSISIATSASAATTNDLTDSDIVLVKKLVAQQKLQLKKNGSIATKGSAKVKINDSLVVTGKTTFKKTVNFKKSLRSSTGDLKINDTVIPKKTATFNLGSSERQWNNIYANLVDGVDVSALETTVNSLTDTTYTAGTGLNLTDTEFTTTLGTAIDSSEITDGTITNTDLAEAYQNEFTNVVVVSPSGATDTENGTLLRSALTAIDDESAINPYLLLVEPGVYDLGTTTLTMSSYVDIQGLGNVYLEGDVSGSSTGLITLNDDVTLRNVFITNTLTSGIDAIGVYSDGASSNVILDKLTISVSGSSNSNNGIFLTDSSATITNTTVSLTSAGSDENNAIVVTTNSTSTIKDSSFTVANGISTNVSMTINNTASATVYQSTISASGAFNYAVIAYGASGVPDSISIHNSIISSGDIDTYDTGGTIYIGASQYNGAIPLGTGTEKCISTYDASFDVVPTTC